MGAFRRKLESTARSGRGCASGRRRAAPLGARLAACAALLVCAPAGAEEVSINGRVGDPDVGELLFGVCQTCHQIGPGAEHRSGPALNNLVGAPAGARGDYPSSFTMVLAGLRGLVWTPETLDAYLENPRATVPNSASPFVGVPSEQERADLIAYLQTAGAVD